MNVKQIATALIAASSLAACSTAPETVWEATLVDASDAQLRQLLRGYVRDTLGPDYIVDPGELSRISTLTARDRGASSIRPPSLTNGPQPDRIFRLEIAAMRSGPICQLRLDGDRNAPVLVLPREIPCERVARII